MMVTFEILLFVLAILGHLVLWPAVVNRVHSWAMPRWIIHALTVSAGVAGGAIPLLITVDYLLWGWTTWPPANGRIVVLAYFIICAVMAVVAVAERARHPHNIGRTSTVTGNHTTVIDIAKVVGHRPLGDGMSSFLGRLPGNEVLKLAVQEKQFVLPRLPSTLDGLRIAHLSDLHICGRITQPYFEEVVRQTNQWRPDLVVITGDIFDRDHCLEWGVETLSKLEATLGVHFIFGNHDSLVDSEQMKEMLTAGGLKYLGGAWRRIEKEGESFLLAGNELPWFAPAADVANMPPRDESGQPVRILLSHAPDQFDWAVATDFDLMLCGHTHGGQICLPVLGAVASPSRHGTRYVAGLFQRENTLMYVSRGTASLVPVRWNCPPELAILTLRSGASAGGSLRDQQP